MVSCLSYSQPICSATGVSKARRGTHEHMSAAGSTFIGIIGAVIFLLAVFSFSQRNWKGGCLWLLVGAVVILLLTYMDKPSAALWR
jgi:uncharacterized membrane protein YeaQ/YmgE (transglycosylase-associated protein family)